MLAMQAYAKPHYLALGLTEDRRVDNIRDEDVEDLEKLDPLRRALRLARRAEDFDETAGRSSNLNSNYIAIKEELDAFSSSILTQCKDMREVKTILEHRPVATKTETWKQSNMMKALWEGRKDFVAHPYYQEYLHKQMAGTVALPPDSQFRNARWCLRNVPYALLLFCCYPIVVFADFFRQADILFETEEETTRFTTPTPSDVEEGGLSCGRSSKVKDFFSFFREKMHTPDFRMTVFVTIQFLYLTTLLLMMWNPINDGTTNTNGCHEVHAFHYIVLVVTAIFVIEDSLDFYINYREKEKANFFESNWNVWSIVFRLILLVGLSVYLCSCNHHVGIKNRAFLSGNHRLNVSSTLICLGVAGEFFKTLQFLLMFQWFGPLVICVINVGKGALKTFPIYFIIFCSYGLFMWGMFKPFHQAFRTDKEDINQMFDFEETAAAESRDGLFHLLFWKILAADPNHEAVQLKKYTNETTSHTNVTMKVATSSHEFSHVVIIVAWAGYQILIAMLMINLLIAIMK